MLHHPIARQAVRAGRVLITAVAAVILLFALVVTLPRLLGYQTYAITSGSMAGTIEPGALVFSRSVPANEVGIGDVITYVPPVETGVTTLVTHRVVAVQPGEDGPVYETKGDANESVDPWSFLLDADNQSVVEFTVPVLGRLVLLLNDPAMRQLAIGLPALAIALAAAADVLRELRSRRGPGPSSLPPAVAVGDTPSARPVPAVAAAAFSAHRITTR